MTTLLHLDSSARTAGSTTRTLTREYVDAYLASHSGTELRYRDLDAEPLPFVSGTWIDAAFSPPDTHDHTLRFALSRSDALVAELLAADHLVIGAPVYNFTVPASLKAWIDQISRAGRTFAYGDSGPYGLLTGKSAVVVSSSGTDPAVLAGAGWDYSTPYLTAVLGFLGITDVEVVRAWGALPEDVTRTTAEARVRLDDLARRRGAVAA